MPSLSLDDREVGIALLLGYAVLVGVLFGNPGAGLERATASARGAVLFVLCPLLGGASGLYALVGGRYHALTSFLGGSYLAFVGIALSLLVRAGSPLVFGAGVLLFALGTAAVAAVLGSALAALVPEWSPSGRAD